MDRLPNDPEVLQQCRAQLAQLQSQGAHICALLRSLSRQVLEDRDVPSAPSIERLQQYRQDFDSLRAIIPRSDAARHGDWEELSLTGLRDELEAQAVIQATLSRLERFSMIQHVEQPEFAPLQRCLADGTKLRQELLSVPAAQARVAAEQFLSPQTPLNAIVTLVSDGPELSDERWSVLLDSVLAAYGREVSTAIARGKLILASETRA